MRSLQFTVYSSQFQGLTISSELKTIAFGARMTFIFEKYSKPYDWYGDASITEEKVIIAQKTLAACSFAVRKKGLVCSF